MRIYISIYIFKNIQTLLICSFFPSPFFFRFSSVDSSATSYLWTLCFLAASSYNCSTGISCLLSFVVEVTWDESEQLPQVAPLQLSPMHCGILLGLDDSGDKQSGCTLSNKKYIWGPSCKSSSLKKYFNVLFHSQEASGWNQINSLSDVRAPIQFIK